MNPEQKRQNTLSFCRIAEEMCRTSKQLCEEAAMLQKTSQDIVRMSRLEREIRQDVINS